MICGVCVCVTLHLAQELQVDKVAELVANRKLREPEESCDASGVARQSLQLLYTRRQLAIRVQVEVLKVNHSCNAWTHKLESRT